MKLKLKKAATVLKGQKDVSFGRGGHRRGLLGALFWQALRGLRKGNQGLAQAVLSQREELVTQIWDIVEQWKKHFDDPRQNLQYREGRA